MTICPFQDWASLLEQMILSSLLCQQNKLLPGRVDTKKFSIQVVGQFSTGQFGTRTIWHWTIWHQDSENGQFGTRTVWHHPYKTDNLAPQFLE